MTGSTQPAVAAPDVDRSLTRQGSRFIVIGSGGTALQLGLYTVLTTLVGAQIASAISWLLSTMVTNGLHRALTFQVHGTAHSRPDLTAAFVTSIAALGITSVVLAQMSDATGMAGLVAIVTVNSVVGAGRFFGMRWWHGRSGRAVAPG